MKDWTGQPGNRAWVGSLVPVIEPTAWLAMLTNILVDFEGAEGIREEEIDE